MAEFLIEFLPGGQTISVAEGTNLLEAARSAGLTPNAPCGGKGTCGKCKVRLLHLPDTPEVLACQTTVEGPMTVRFLSDENKSQVISTSSNLKLGRFPADSDSGYCVAFDIGTTTVAAVRSGLGAAQPFDILPAVWLSSAVSVATAVAAAKLFRGGGRL